MMFKTKFELDKHVGKILMRARTDSEKNKEGLKIAKLYIDIKEFETADFYLSNYLSEFSLDAFGWKLKAEVAELSEKNWIKAADYYIKSYKISDESDKKLLLKICNCFFNVPKLDSIKAKEWLEKASKIFPNEKIIVNLKEKLVDSIETLDEKEIQEWESFLINAINENCLDQELNLKFISINLKCKNYLKAFKHLIKIEYKSLFERDSKWHDLLLNLIKPFMESEEFKKLDKSTKLIFYLMTIKLMINQILNLMIIDDLTVLKYTFLRLDQFILKFEREELFDFKEKFIQIVYNEIVSQHFYILGLLFLKNMTNEAYNVSLSDDEFSKDTKVGLLCLVKSMSCSKPNSAILNSNDFSKTKKDSIMNLVVQDYFKLLHRDSCCRYSSIGNWIKFFTTMTLANDNSKILKIIDFSTQNFKADEYFAEFLNIKESNDYLLFRNKQGLDIKYSNFYDNNALDYANKICLENKSLDLNYLIWHGLVNTNFFSKCDDIPEIPAYFFFHSSKNSVRFETNFGVENLNICNFESLSLMDLKIFYYSVFYQALSRLKSTKKIFIRPFWLEPGFSISYQSDWWLYSTQQVLRSKTSQNFMSSSLDEFSIFAKIDSKKQSEILKILELIRLKNPNVKISTETKNEIKYKVNLEIIICVAKYLQFLNDSIDSLNVIQSLEEREKILETYGHSFVMLNSEVSKSPKEKQFYIKNYLLKYWNFILKQLIKLKQISYSVEDCIDQSTCDTSLLSESTMNIACQTNQLNLFDDYFVIFKACERGMISPVKALTKEGSFSENVKLFSPKLISLESNSPSRYHDSIIQSALLNLVLIFSLPDYPTDEMNTFQNLDEAIKIFSSVNELLKNKWTNTLDVYQLQVCKKLAENLVLQRDALLLLKSKNTESFFQCNMNENLDKVQTLIELTKNKINNSFKKTTDKDSDHIIQSINESFESSFIHENENGANTSISESIKLIEKFFVYKAENTPEARKKRAEYEEEQKIKEQEKTEREKIEREEELKRLELEEKVIKERELENQKKKEFEEEEKRKLEEKERQAREEKEQLKKELQIHQEKIKKLEQDEALRWSKQKDEMEKEKIRFRNEINEEMIKKVKEFEVQQKKSIDQIDSSYKDDKISGLIDTLNKQRSHYFEMNKETLNEQFSFIKNQNRKIMNELRQIRSCNNNRQKLHTEFRQVVKNFKEICDSKLFNARFNIFYWLFQHNPKLAQQMWHQQNVMNEIKRSEEVKKAQTEPKAAQATPEVKTPTRNHSKFNETSYLSVNEFQTPETRVSQKSFLEKPIADIKFPSNINILEQLRKSADAFNSSQQSLDNEDEGEYYDEEGEYYGDENYQEDDEADGRMANENTKQDTFLSCEDFDLNKSDLTKSSINELQVLFNQNAYLYTYDISKKLWIPKGKCKLEVIGDEISQKGEFKAHIICNLLDDKKVSEFNVSRFTNLGDFKNSTSAIYWFETKKALNNCCEPAGARFESDLKKNEFKNVIENCQKKMENNKSKLETRSSNSFLCPTDLLPDDLVCKFEKQITFILDEKFHQTCSVLNITPIDKVYFLTIKQNEAIIFKHIIASDQSYEISEKPKLHQHIFKYRITAEQVRVDNLAKKQSNENTVFDISLIFSSSPALNEFINVLNLKKN